MIGERLKQFAKEKYLSLKGLADALEISPQQLSAYANGTRNPGAQMLQKLQGVGCDIDWLLGKELLTETNSYQTKSNDVLMPNDISGHDILPGMEVFEVDYVPLIAFAHAGTAQTPEERVIVDKHIMVPRGISQNKRLAAIEIVGDSMEPKYHEGDIVVINMASIDPLTTKPKREYIVVTEEGSMLKHIRKTNFGTVELVSINSIYEPITPKHFYGIYEVMGMFRWG